MREIELKILDIDAGEVSRKLLQLGATSSKEVLVIDRIYDYPDQRIRLGKCLMRLRQIGDQALLCFKGNRSQERGFLAHDEHEVTVSSAEQTEQILLGLGLQRTKYLEKKRTSFVIGRVHIEIDQYPTIPAYLEIEGEEREISEVLAKFDYAISQTTNMTANRVLEHYGVDVDLQRFEK